MKKNISLVLVIVILSSYNNIDFSKANDLDRLNSPANIQSEIKNSEPSNNKKNFKELSSESSISSGQYSISLGLSNKSIKDFSFTSGMENTASARLSPSPTLAMPTIEEPISLGICPNGGTLERLGTCDDKGKKGHEECYLTSGGCCHKGNGGDEEVHPIETIDAVEVTPDALQDALIKVEDDLENLRGMINLLKNK